MDPLSICASVVALAQLSVTIAKSLHGLGKDFLNAESQITALCAEITTLSNFLSSVDNTLKECQRQSRVLTLMDVDLWHQCELAVMNCQITLNELNLLVDRIKDSRPPTVIWRVKVAVDLSIHARELESFRAEINKSNRALQTMFHTITVSLSLRNNISQELILFELDRLKSSIDDALKASLQSSGHFIHGSGDRPNTRVARNLRDLAKAAHKFHSTASSTAGTSRGEGSIDIWTEQHEADSSVANGLTPFKKERLNTFIRSTPEVYEPQSMLNWTVGQPPDQPSSPQPEPKAAVRPISLQNEEDSSERHITLGSDGNVGLLIPVVEVLEEFALESMKRRDFREAVRFLEDAISKNLDSPGAGNVVNRLQIRLATCYFFQHDRRRAELIVNSLAECSWSLDLEICNLMHTLALAHLNEYSFDRARKDCTRAIDAKIRLFGKAHPETLESMGLLATIYDMSSNIVYQEAIRRMIPQGFEYIHPRSELEFLIAHTMLLPAELRYSAGEIVVLAELDDGVTKALSNDELINGLNTARIREGHVKSQLRRLGMLEMDTNKEVVIIESQSIDIKDSSSKEANSAEDQTTPIVKRRLTRGVSRLLGAGTLRRTNRNLNIKSNLDDITSVDEGWFTITKSKRRLKKRRKLDSPGSSPSSGDRNQFNMFGLRRVISSSQSTNMGAEDQAMRLRSWMRGHQLEAKPIAATLDSSHFDPAPTNCVLSKDHGDGHITDEHYGYWSPLKAPRVGHEQLARYDILDRIPAELADTSPPVELWDTGLSPMEITLKYRPTLDSSGSRSILSNSLDDCQHDMLVEYEDSCDVSKTSEESGQAFSSLGDGSREVLVGRECTLSCVKPDNATRNPLETPKDMSQDDDLKARRCGAVSSVRRKGSPKSICPNDYYPSANQQPIENLSIGSTSDREFSILRDVAEQQASCNQALSCLKVGRFGGRETSGPMPEVSICSRHNSFHHTSSRVGLLRVVPVSHDDSPDIAASQSSVIHSLSDSSKPLLQPPYTPYSPKRLGNRFSMNAKRHLYMNLVNVEARTPSVRIKRTWSWVKGDDSLTIGKPKSPELRAAAVEDQV